MEKIFYTWEQIDTGVEELVSQIKKSKLKFDGLYGIPRGGLPLAVMLSYQLNLPLLVYPTVNTLVVDDISDTGKTLMSMKNKKIACLFNSKWTKVKPDFYAYTKTNKQSWIMFPWGN